jgi:WD40 repeat protein
MDFNSQRLMMMNHNYLGTEFPSFLVLSSSYVDTSTPVIRVYGRLGSSFSQVAQFGAADGLYGSNGKPVWSNDGTLLLYPGGFTKTVTVFKRSGNAISKLAELAPSGAMGGSSRSVIISPSGQYIADSSYHTLGGTDRKMVCMYKVSGDTFINFLNIDTGSNSYIGKIDMSWSQDGSYFTGLVASTAVGVYKLTETGSSFPTVALLTTFTEFSEVYATAWGANGVYLAIAGRLASNSRYVVRVYKRTADTFTLLTAVHDSGAYSAKFVEFSYDGVYLTYSLNVGSGAVKLYKRTVDAFAVVTTANSFTNQHHFAFSKDGTEIFITLHNTTVPDIKKFTKSGDDYFSSYATSLSAIPTGSTNTLAYYPSALYG